MQALALGDLAATAVPAAVDQLLPIEGPSQRHQQGLVKLAGDLTRRLDQAIEPHHDLASATPTDLRRDERANPDVAAIPALARNGGRPKSALSASCPHLLLLPLP